jgi:glycosyltransferase A (GT-A) superfamily protein (DUF2064 family)
MAPTRIVIFAKAPVPGAAKTRLIPALGQDGAARLAAQMLADTTAVAVAADLGERLARAASRVLAAGERVLLIGTDCPALDARRLRTAADTLNAHDAVIHPTHDGGYALLGLRRFNPLLFSEIAWSTASVAEETIARIRTLGWSLHIADTLHDIDEPDDLPELPAEYSIAQ